MAYDFHYTPTGTGVISGKEVLEQTEDAINDLGNTAISGVQEALDKAEQALTNSENAVDDAQTALNTANNAEGVAIQAQTDVGNLSGTVTNIGNRVTTAEGNISNLQGRMTTAEGNITNIQGRMTTAETNIGNLQTAVSTAQATANSAQQTATTARQQSYVFRYSSTAVVPNSTIAYSTIDNTDNIKSGDKILDVDGKLFEITAVDTTNQTVTVGTALIDLALDANVVHTNKNDDVSIPLNSTSAELGVTGGSTNITFSDKNGKNLSGLTLGNYGSSKLSYARLNIFDKDTNNNEIQDTLEYAYISNNNNAYLRVYRDNFCTLGSSSYRWKGVYATNYYYGSDNVEFSTKFVTTDTNQTIDGIKTFPKGLRIYNTNTSDNTSAITLRTSKVSRGSTTDGGDSLSVMFNDRGDSLLSSVRCTKVSNGTTQLRNIVNTTDTSDNIITCETQLNIAKNGDKYFAPSENSQVNLGSSSFGWKGVYAQNYYYGSDNIEFSTKFVTTDTAQTVSGQKVFDDINVISNSAELGVSAGNNSFKILDKNKKTISRLEGGTFSSGMAYSYWLVNNGSDVFNGVSLYQSSSSLAQLRPYSSTLSLQLGASNRYFSDCYTSKINGLTPSSLGMPTDNKANIIDISGYLTVLDGSQANTYQAPDNGYIGITMSNCTGIQAYITGFWGNQVVRPTSGAVRLFMPICKNMTANILIFGGTLDNARFFPCQGNI